MWKIIVKLGYLFSAIAGVVAGVISALLVIYLTPNVFWVQNDVWKTSLLFGSEKADPYTRAIIAKNQLYVLNRSEAVYFIANSDGERRLNRNCDYRMVGGDLPAMFIPDNSLIPDLLEFQKSIRCQVFE